MEDKINESNLRVLRPEREEIPLLELENFHVWIGDNHILNDLNLKIYKNRINCIIGPSGGGKSTLIRSINRINDDTRGIEQKGRLLFEGRDIYAKSTDPVRLRGEIGMVFQKPCVFPVSILENTVFGAARHKKLSRREKLQIAEENLRAAALWKEVQPRLDESASALSIGQQQRLCIARTLAVKPDVILLDEPTSALDPISTRAIEDLMVQLKEDYTILFVTHNIGQAKRIADRLIFMCEGRVIESGPATQIFKCPSQEQTRTYLTEEYCDC